MLSIPLGQGEAHAEGAVGQHLYLSEQMSCSHSLLHGSSLVFLAGLLALCIAAPSGVTSLRGRVRSLTRIAMRMGRGVHCGSKSDREPSSTSVTLRIHYSVFPVCQHTICLYVQLTRQAWGSGPGSQSKRQSNRREKPRRRLSESSWRASSARLLIGARKNGCAESRKWW
jgi:hypothetical protein